MPILLNVSQLEPGMFLSRNIVNDFSVLLPCGRRLNEHDIAALRRRYPDLMVQVGDPVLDEFAEFQDDTHDIEVSREVRGKIKNAAQKVTDSIRAGVDLKSDNVSGIQDMVQDIMSYLQDNPVTMAALDQVSEGNDALQQHSANVFYLCLLMGNTLRNYIKKERERLSAAKSLNNAMDLTPLGLAAFFFDLGMVPLQSLVDKEEPLTYEEIQRIKAHPLAALEILPPSFNPMARLAIRQHHENMDGTGYPGEVEGKKINIFARILRIADAYSAATAKRAHREAKTPIRALYEMLYSNYRSCYDPILLKVFAGIQRPLPVGAKIHFEDGRPGVLVRHSPHSPFHPEIIMAFDELGDAIPKEELQPPFLLQDHPDRLVREFAGEDISYLNGLDPEGLTASENDILDLEHHEDEVFDLMYP